MKRSNCDYLFEQQIDQLLEDGHWKVWDGKERISFIVDPKGWAKYDTLNPSTGMGKKPKRQKNA